MQAAVPVQLKHPGTAQVLSEFKPNPLLGQSEFPSGCSNSLY